MALALTAVLGTGTVGHQARAAAGGALASLEAEPLAQVSAMRAPHTLYLDIVLDGRVVSTLVRFHVVGERLSVDPEVLVAAGLKLPDDLPRDGQGRVALDRIPGLGVQFEPTLQQVTLSPGLHLRPTHHLGYRAPAPLSVTRDHGLVLDWDVYGRSFDGRQSLSLGTGARWFGRLGTLEVNGLSRAGAGGSDAYTRLDTRWSYSDPGRMTTWSAGDVVSGGLGWTRPVRLGGVQWRREFGVRPDLIVYPLPRFSADATLPSSVELFVNNVRQRSEDIAPGPFVISNFPRVVGAGQAVVVVTDALGRSSQTSVPLYVDYQRLARGLSDFSLEAGVLRRGFGIGSSDYGDDLVASASYRRGLRDDFTLELHGEAGPGLQLGGAGLAWSPLARYGVVTASYARSQGDSAAGDSSVGDSGGDQLAVGYQWFGQRAGFDLHAQRASAGYRDLGTLDGGSRPLRAQDRASLWFGVPRGSLSLTWLRFRDAQDVPSRTLSLGLSQSYRRLSLSANAFRDDRAGHGLSLTVSLPLGRDLYSSFNADHRRGDTDFSASLRRNAPYRGGWGWQAQARDNGDGQLSARYRGRAGEVEFGVDRLEDRHGAYTQGHGSLVMMDRQTFTSRRISDAFAVVSSNGVGDVPILYENRVAGRTNDDGYLLLADLRGWQRNRIAIDPDGLGASLQVPAIERLVTPADRSGIRVRFAIEPIRAATLVLRGADGVPVEPGTRVQREDGSEAIVGFDGELWLENYVDREVLRWGRRGAACTAATPALPPSTTMSRLGPVSCAGELAP
ncbi:fimbria/pilus outer membrane usher protein [Lysobacter sp. D1-1-M9]|uniref:fimbria/pilus outer membrane usher protein n=1 Tax=Novilysobacter longmucuonensis TaxID=3098603 RepID=UPI002FC6FBCB